LSGGAFYDFKKKGGPFYSYSDRWMEGSIAGVAARTEIMEEEEETDRVQFENNGPPSICFPACIFTQVNFPNYCIFFLAAVENIYIHQMAREKKGNPACVLSSTSRATSVTGMDIFSARRLRSLVVHWY